MASGFADRLNEVSALTVVGGVFGVVLITALWRLPAAMKYSDGCFSVKGVPYSDASAWDELAVNLAAGRGFEGGFSAQRPLYPAMVSLFYMATGPSLLVAKGLNALWLAMAAAAVCAIGIKGGSRLAGLAGAMEIAFGEDYISFSQLLLTETLGVLFGAAAVLALAVALAKPEAWRIAIAGLLLACANLASGFGFLALIGFGLVAFFTWAVRIDVWGALWRSLFLAIMVALVWSPWIARQHMVHGVNNLSTSSANLMYATATEDGRWGTEVAAEWQQDGVKDTHGERYRYYMEKYAAAVKDHPVRYLQTIWRGMTTFFRWWEFHGPDHFGVVLLGLMGAAVFLFRNAEPWAAAVSSIIVLVAMLALHGLSAVWMWPLATVLVIYVSPAPNRPLWALVSIGIPFVAVLTGMTGGSLGRRMWTCCEWGMPLMLVAGGAGTMRLLATQLQRLAIRQKHGPTYVPTVVPVVQEKGSHQKQHQKQKLKRSSSFPARGVSSFATFLGLVLIGHAAVASIAAAAFYFALEDNAPRAAITVPREIRAQALEQARKESPTLRGIPADDARLSMFIGEFGEYVCELAASEYQNHWARGFEVRPYERTVAFPRLLEQLPPGRATLQMRARPRDIPRKTPLLIIGVRNIDPKAHLGHDIEMIEVLGFVPVEVNSASHIATPDFTRVTWLPPTPEAEKILEPASLP